MLPAESRLYPFPKCIIEVEYKCSTENWT